MNAQLLNETRQLACTHLLIDPDCLSQPLDSKEQLIMMLSPIIGSMLNSDMSKLLHVLYRIDVEENQVKQIISTEKPDLVATSLTRLIVDREIQKAKTRIKYRSAI